MDTIRCCSSNKKVTKGELGPSSQSISSSWVNILALLKVGLRSGRSKKEAEDVFGKRPMCLAFNADGERGLRVISNVVV